MKYLFFSILMIVSISKPSLSKELKLRQIAPEIVQQNSNGDSLQLSSLKGKVVLVDFWASWCAPCRKENTKLVEAYENFKDASFKNGEGFTVFSVSLDESKKAWENAIVNDKLSWPYHVNDFKGWQNEAAIIYNVKAVPTNFLIDGNGKIVAINLRGNQLSNQLTKLQKNYSFWKHLWN